MDILSLKTFVGIMKNLVPEDKPFGPMKKFDRNDVFHVPTGIAKPIQITVNVE
jgi:hypothetical protein